MHETSDETNVGLFEYLESWYNNFICLFPEKFFWICTIAEIQKEQSQRLCNLKHLQYVNMIARKKSCNIVKCTRFFLYCCFIDCFNATPSDHLFFISVIVLSFLFFNIFALPHVLSLFSFLPLFLSFIFLFRPDKYYC